MMGLWIDRFGLIRKKLAGIMNTLRVRLCTTVAHVLKKNCTPKKKPVIS